MSLPYGPSPGAPRSTEDTAVVLALPGMVCADAIETLRDNLYDLLRKPGTHVILDASEVEAISAAGIGVLIAAALLAQQTGSTLQITGPSTALCRVLARHEHVAEILDAAC
jgi:anti-anti-sigma factor